MSPMARSLENLRQRGYEVAIVEHYNHHSKKTYDLFGWADILGVKNGVTIGVQTTTTDNMAARVKKMGENIVLPVCKAAGWKIECHGWAKRGGRGERKLWALKLVEL